MAGHDAGIAAILAVIPDRPRPASRTPPHSLEALSDGLEPRLVNWALSVADAAAAEVREDVAPSRVEALADVIGRSIEAISINLVRYLLSGRDSPSAVRISRAQRQTAVDSVDLDIPLTRILGGMRALERHWRRAVIELVLEFTPSARVSEQLISVDRSLAIYFDAVIDENSRIYLDERQRLAEERATGQRQLLTRLVAGQAVDDDSLHSAFGAQSTDEFLVLAVRGSSEDGVRLDFASYRRDVERSFRDHAVTALPADRDSMWIVLGGPALPVATVLDRLKQLSTSGALVAFGMSGPGAEGLRRAHQTALATADVQLRNPALQPVAAFADHGLLALLEQRRDLARWYIEQELGAMAREGVPDDLLKTLKTLIGTGGSLARTAEALYVHRNTIAYRLRRVTDLLGRDPLARPVETYAALLLLEQAP